MSDDPREAGAYAGLCAMCRHVQIVRSSRTSVFFLCRRSEYDKRFPKYPRLPVLSCIGFERTAAADRIGERDE